MSRLFRKIVLFWSDCHGNDTRAKHGNERNYKTKHRSSPYLGDGCMSIVRTKP